MVNVRVWSVLLVSLGLAACSQPVTELDRPFQDIGERVAFAGFGADAVEAAERERIAEGLQDADTSDDAFLRMVQSVGGYSKFNELMDTLSNEEAEALHKKFGIEFASAFPNEAKPSQNLTEQDFKDCVEKFPSSDRNKTYNVSGHIVHIDGSGRPKYSRRAYFGPVGSGKRDLYCQAKVGKMGIVNDEGGHLIATQLGGWGRLANLVPQNANFNRGSWRLIEDAIKQCANGISPNYYDHFTEVGYSNTSTLRPYRIQVSLRAQTVLFRKETFNSYINFANASEGGSNGRALVATFRNLLFRTNPECRK